MQTSGRQIEIREATSDDNQALIELQKRCPTGTTLEYAINTPDFFARAKAHQNYKVFNAYSEGRLVGSASCSIQPVLASGVNVQAGYEFQYFTDPELRNQGIARQLQAKIEEYFKAQAVAYSYALVLESNHSMMRLLEKQNFRLFRKLKGQYIEPIRKIQIIGGHGVRLRPANPDDYPEIAKLSNSTWQGYNLYKPLTGRELAAQVTCRPEFRASDILVMEAEQRGDLVACLGIWDLSRVLEVKMGAPNLGMKLTSQLLEGLRKIKPMPVIPKQGHLIQQWSLNPIAYRNIEALKYMYVYMNNLAVEKKINQIISAYDPECEIPEAIKANLFAVDTVLQMYVKILRQGFKLSSKPVFINNVDL